ncbi:MAG: FHA domain-containing protein, partial [Planctomycetes bacterium]|nr:FHA domain-containing protein [Planctomycetota bacterium]
MPTLYVLSGPEIGRQIEVDDGAVLGRADDCDAVLRHLSVSRRHARVELKRAGWRVVDLGSRNGLFLNGERVKKLFVEDGTEFRLGDLELRLRFAPGEPTDATETAEPAADLPSGLEETLVREAPELAPAPDVIEDDFEFADETPVAAPALRAAASEELALEEPDEITLEEPDEIELEDAPR